MLDDEHRRQGHRRRHGLKDGLQLDRAQRFTSGGGEVQRPSTQNRIFKQLGYDSMVLLDDADSAGSAPPRRPAA